MKTSRSLALATTLAGFLASPMASAESAVAYRCGLESINPTEIMVPANVPALPFEDKTVGNQLLKVAGTATPAVAGMENPLALDASSVAPFGAGWLLRLSSPMTEGQRHSFEVVSECDGGRKATAVLKVLAGPPAVLPVSAGTLTPLEKDGVFSVRLVPSADLKPFLEVARHSLRLDGVTNPYGSAYGTLDRDLPIASPQSGRCQGKAKGEVVPVVAELTVYIAGVAEPLPPVSATGSVVCDPYVPPPPVIRDAGDEKTTSGDDGASSSSGSSGSSGSNSGGCTVAPLGTPAPWAIGLALPVLGLLLRRRKGR